MRPDQDYCCCNCLFQTSIFTWVLLAAFEGSWSCNIDFIPLKKPSRSWSLCKFCFLIINSYRTPPGWSSFLKRRIHSRSLKNVTSSTVKWNVFLGKRRTVGGKHALLNGRRLVRIRATEAVKSIPDEVTSLSLGSTGLQICPPPRNSAVLGCCSFGPFEVELHFKCMPQCYLTRPNLCFS